MKADKAGRILWRRNRPIKASTLAMDKSRIESHIKPLLGKALVHTLKIADIERMQSDIVGGKTAKPRGEGRGGVTTGGPGVAARTVSTLQNARSSCLPELDSGSADVQAVFSMATLQNPQRGQS